MKHLLFIFFVLFLSKLAFSQQGLVKSYYNNSDTLKSEINYSNNIREGKAVFYYPNGNPEEELFYQNGKVEGLVKEYYPNGKLKIMYNVSNGKRDGQASLFDTAGNYLKDIYYENGKLLKEELNSPSLENAGAALLAKNDSTAVKEDSLKISNLKKKAEEVNLPSISERNVIIDNNMFLTSADIMPVPYHGIEGLQKKLVYPEAAKKNKIEGTVDVRAYVDSLGEVVKAEVIKGIGYGCDEAAETVVYYSSFKPAINKGVRVNAQVVIPIVFKLNKE